MQCFMLQLTDAFQAKRLLTVNQPSFHVGFVIVSEIISKFPKNAFEQQVNFNVLRNNLLQKRVGFSHGLFQ